MNEPKKPEHELAEKKRLADNAEKPAEEAQAEEKKPSYVFKILPVDPKNSFDFEDVADK